MLTAYSIRNVSVDFPNRVRHSILANKSQIHQVIINILLNSANAIDRMPKTDRKIHVSLYRDDQNCVVIVSDFGPGIPRNQLENVFENFFTTNSDDLEMGLAVCRSIINSHQGRTWAESADDEPCAHTLFALPIGCSTSSTTSFPRIRDQTHGERLIVECATRHLMA